MLPVSAQRAIIRPMAEYYENQTACIWQKEKFPLFFYNLIVKKNLRQHYDIFMI
jgi:hypothetical protein